MIYCDVTNVKKKKKTTVKEKREKMKKDRDEAERRGSSEIKRGTWINRSGIIIVTKHALASPCAAQTIH